MKLKEKICFLICIFFSIIITLTFLLQEIPNDVLPTNTKYDQNSNSINHIKEDKDPQKEANDLENTRKIQNSIKPTETRPTNNPTFTITNGPTTTLNNSSIIDVHINSSSTNDVSIATVDDSKNIVTIATIDDSKNIVTIATIDGSKNTKDSSGSIASVDNTKDTNNSSKVSANIDSPKDINNSSAKIADVDSSKGTKDSSAGNDADDETLKES